MKTKTILIGAGIASALFIVYWFFIRKGKAAGISQVDEIAELEKTFKTGNPYAGKTAEPLNATYNLSESSANPPFKASWLPDGGQPRELISKAQFDAKVYTTIKSIIAEAKAGRPEWLNSIKEQMLQSWRPIALSGNNTSLAEALAYEARYFTGASYYYNGGGTAAPGGGATAPPSANIVMFQGREYEPTNIANIYHWGNSIDGHRYLDTTTMLLMNWETAKRRGVIGFGIPS